MEFISSDCHQRSCCEWLSTFSPLPVYFCSSGSNGVGRVLLLPAVCTFRFYWLSDGKQVDEQPLCVALDHHPNMDMVSQQTVPRQTNRLWAVAA